MLYEFDMNNGSRFIVLSGEAGAGKDAVAKILIAEHGFEMMSLSDFMKDFAEKVFGWSKEQLYGPSSLRNEPDPRWARPCKECEGRGIVSKMTTQWPSDISSVSVSYEIRDVACAKCEGAGKINDNSPRRVLQLLGSDWSREMIHPDIWTMASRARFDEALAAGKSIVVNDARFSNDRQNMHDWHGAVRVDVRTSRERDPKKMDVEWRKHASETDLASDDDVDYIVHNDERWPFPLLPTTVKTMLSVLYPSSHPREAHKSAGQHPWSKQHRDHGYLNEEDLAAWTQSLPVR